MTNQKIEKPILRGHFHQAAFFIALGACAMLLTKGHNLRTHLSLIIYSISLITLFGVSAIYHRPNWSPSKRAFFRRLDHSAIYFLISGTSTPIAMFSLQPSSLNFFLYLTWVTAIVGMIFSLIWVNAPKWVSSTIYIMAAFMVLPYMKELFNAMTFAMSACLVLGGVFYVVGAVIYAMKKPNPYPKYFGYHEIFHILVVVAAIFHFILVYNLVA